MTEHFGRAAHPRLPPAEVLDPAFEARHREIGDRPDRGAREHEPADRVEVTGEDVYDVDEPAGERPELLVAESDAAVDDGPLGRREFASEGADAIRTDPRYRRDALRRPVGDERLDAIDPVEEIGDMTELHEALTHDDVGDCEEHCGIGA